MDTLPLFATELLPILSRHELRFIIVGATAAVLAGAPILTNDLDLLIDTEEDNLQRALDATRELGAIYRDPARRRIEPSLEKLRTLRLHLLRCSRGDFDLLVEVGHAWRYRQLLERSLEVELDFGKVWVLDLAAVIETKEIANRDKDRAALPVLRETLRLSRLKDGGG